MIADAAIVGNGDTATAYDAHGIDLAAGDTAETLAAVLACLPFGGRIALSGPLTLSETLTLTAPYHLVGNGAGNATRSPCKIHDPRTDGTDAIRIASPGCVLEGFRLTGSASQRCGILIEDVWSPGTILRNLFIGSVTASGTGFGGANVYSHGSRYIQIDKCNIGGGYVGVKTAHHGAQEANTTTITDCNIAHNVSHGVHVDTGSFVRLLDSAIQFNGGNGLRSVVPTGVPQSLISGCWFESNALGDIAFENGRDATVQGGTLSSVALAGVEGAEIRGASRIAADSCRDIIVYPRTTGFDLQGDLGQFRLDSISARAANILSGAWLATKATVFHGPDMMRGPGSMKIVCADPGGAGTSNLMQSFADFGAYRGRTLTLGGWVCAPETNDRTQRLTLWDKTGHSANYTVPKDGAWHWGTATLTVADDATALRAYLFAKSTYDADTDDTLCVGGLKLVEGTVCLPDTGS